ncbi:MAG: BON domain-containing protein [Sphingomonas sp.]
MKTDNQIQTDVEAELKWEPSVSHAHIAVVVDDGVVTLNGHVGSLLQKMAVEKAVRRVAGVRAIAEELIVRYPSDRKVADDQIAARICDLFTWDALIPADRIAVKVEHGRVTLTGEVDWHFERDAARKAAGRISGVTAVINLINLHVVPTAADVKDHIVAAIKRHADIDAKAITVITDGSKVRLGGLVHAWHDRDIAERAAWAAPGVTMIEDNIVVA